MSPECYDARMISSVDRRTAPFRPIRRPARMSFIALVAALIATVATGCEEEGRQRVVISGRTFDLEIAADEASRTRGMMGRTEIPEDGGMLFVFPDAGPRSFWMANCLVDIDIIYLDPLGRITAMHRMRAEPPKQDNETQLAYEQRLSHYPSRFPAQFAIELRAGTLDELDLEVEDRIDLPLDRLKALAR